MAGRKNRAHRPAWCDARGSGRGLLRKIVGASGEIRRRESGILCHGSNPSGSLLVLRRHPVSRRQRVLRYRTRNDHQRETSIPKMERPMRKPKLPKTDSIQELAEFWDAHDLTDFEQELEEVPEPVFVSGTVINVPLESGQAIEVERMAQAKGVSREELVRAWVLQKLARRRKSRTAKN